MINRTFKIATRQSILALWQANHVAQLLTQLWPSLQIELLPMLTSGDRFLKNKLQTLGGKGLFVKELEEALLDGRADLAVHSMKDVPAHLPAGLVITAICQRDNPLDAFVSAAYPNLAALPKKSIIGTTSLRRQAQLLALRPDLIIKPLRGNIHTRLAKLQAQEFDAIILAAAGLERLAMHEQIKEVMAANIMLPACGQGALGIECRTDDHAIKDILAPLNDPASALCVNTERQVNALLGGNCHVPLAVYCTLPAQNQLLLQAKVMSLDGTVIIDEQQCGLPNEAAKLAAQCTQRLLAKGAQHLLDAANE